MERQPEPEYMDLEVEAAAYAAADFAEVNAAFVERLLEVAGTIARAVAIDLGTGPGDIPLRVAARRSGWRILAMDASWAMLRRAGYPILLSRRMGIATNSHQCGTLRFGDDPGSSVLDRFCRAHDLDNLYVVDGSFFPSSTAVNPALTIAAQAMRVADHLRERYGFAAPGARQPELEFA